MTDNIKITNLPDGKAKATLDLVRGLWDYEKDGPTTENKDKFLKLVAMCSRALDGHDNDPWDK